MARLKVGHILILVIALVLLGALAWGVGWVAHSLFDRSSPAPPPATAPATVMPTSPPTWPPPASAPSPVPTSPVLSTPAPTSTPMPTLTPTPEEEWEIVQQGGEGLYQVCRRHCPGIDQTPPDLVEYAQRVADLNDLPWPNPILFPGQRLRMPRCP